MSSSEYTQTHLKKRRDNTDQHRKEREARISLRRRSAGGKASSFKRVEKFLAAARRKQKSVKRLIRRTRAIHHQELMPEGHENKIYFVIRTVGNYGIDPQVRRVLRRLRVEKENTGAFVRVTPATIKMLNIVSRYITWGIPNTKNIHNLLHKRGHGTIRSAVRALTSNADIEKALGKYGIICLDDIVHELTTCGSNFEVLNAWLEPFKLHVPPGGWKSRFTPFTEGGESGDRGDAINELLKHMV